MAAGTLEQRVQELESKMEEVSERLEEQIRKTTSGKRGWRWFVVIDAVNPHFDEAARLGKEWRYADRPKDDPAP